MEFHITFGIIVLFSTILGNFFLKEDNDTDKILNRLFLYTGIILSNITFAIGLILKEISKLS